MTIPGPQEVEVSVFGPGFGECIVIHVGNGKWIVVDSCVDPNKRGPVGIEYLESMGVDPGSVLLLVATHWHDDHIRGFSELVRKCSNASICISSIFTSEEFLTYICANTNRTMAKVSSGVSEMRGVLEACKSSRRTLILGSDSKRILHLSGSEFDHGHSVQVWSLSPDGRSYSRFLSSLSKLMPQVGTPKRRAPRVSPNDCSVVLFIEIGPLGILLGADLEEANGCQAWSAIVESQTRPKINAGFFKVPHHGSGNAHHPEVWRKMLTADPVYAVAPYNKGSKLPTVQDRARLLSSARRGYITIDPASRRSLRSGSVSKMIKGFNVSLVQAMPSAGHVRAKCACPDDCEFADPELLCGAAKLQT